MHVLLSDLTINISASTAAAVATNDLSFYAQVTDKAEKEVNQNFFGTFNATAAVVVAEPTQNSADETVYDKTIEKMVFSNVDTIDHTVNISMVSVSGMGVAPFVMQSTLLLAGERMEYVNGLGWSVYDVNGLKKNCSAVADEITIIDEVTPNITYIGKAAPGSLLSDPAWSVMRIDETVAKVAKILWADGNSNKDNIWNDRAILTYL